MPLGRHWETVGAAALRARHGAAGQETAGSVITCPALTTGSDLQTAATSSRLISPRL
jgi:hypothetical protein